MDLLPDGILPLICQHLKLKHSVYTERVAP